MLPVPSQSLLGLSPPLPLELVKAITHMLEADALCALAETGRGGKWLVDDERSSADLWRVGKNWITECIEGRRIAAHVPALLAHTGDTSSTDRQDRLTDRPTHPTLHPIATHTALDGALPPPPAVARAGGAAASAGPARQEQPGGLRNPRPAGLRRPALPPRGRDAPPAPRPRRAVRCLSLST